MKYFLRASFLLILIQSHLVLAEAPAEKPTNTFQFLHTQGTQIVGEDNQPIFFHGVAFGNRVWDNDRIPRQHHTEEDYVRVRNMGMNLIRFYINYKTFESDGKPYTYLDDGWAWLDDNIAWAKAHGVYLILNVHIPQGGFQSQGTGWALWDNEENQKRLTALWKAIATRYKNESVIMGYDLLNEPGVSRYRTQWQTLAQTMVNEIRSVDSRHPIFVERVNSVHKNWSNDAEMNFVKVQDNNVIYEFHIYDPFYYTHQLAVWDDYLKNHEGGIWPDESNNHTRKFLAHSIDQYVAWGKKNNVPLFLGEWGLYKANYENNRGGLNWIKDMISIIEERKITNTFHVYHEESFGIYRGEGKIDPNNANQALINLFQQEYSL